MKNLSSSHECHVVCSAHLFVHSCIRSFVHSFGGFQPPGTCGTLAPWQAGDLHLIVSVIVPTNVGWMAGWLDGEYSKLISPLK